MRFSSLPLVAALIAVPLLAGCVTPPADDTLQGASADVPMGDHVTAWAKELPETITGLAFVGRAVDVPSGSGIWVHGDFAYVSGRDTGFHVVNLTDPASPTLESSIVGEFYSRDVDFLSYPNGTHVAVAAGASGGMHFVDVTTPAAAQLIATLELPDGSHNLAVVPGTTIVLNAASDGAGGTITAVDAANPWAPVVAYQFGDHGCHDITFFMSEEKQRLYCPGIQETQIFDIADLQNPVVVSRITNAFISPSGVAPVPGQADPGLHHLAMVDESGETLIIGDEFTGGLGPGCGASAAGRSTPLGALWFYDISGENEKAPVEMGSFAPTVPAQGYAMGGVNTVTSGADPVGAAFGLSCTSHFGQIIPGKNLLAMGWYRAGTILLDISDPSAVVQVDQFNEGTNTWDVRYSNGYLFTGDMNRGLDVLTFE